MKIMSRGASLFLSLLLSLPCNAAADNICLTTVNKTDLELKWFSVYMDAGSMSTNARVVPGNTMTLCSGNDTVFNTVKILAGTRYYTFANMNITGAEEHRYLFLREDGTPEFSPHEASPESSNGAITGIAASLFGETIPSMAQAVDLAQVLSAPNMGALHALGLRQAPDFLEGFILPVKFGEELWAAHISSERNLFIPADELRMDSMMLYADGGDISRILKALSRARYRPWYGQVNQGKKMENTLKTFHFSDRNAFSGWEDMEKTLEATLPGIAREQNPTGADIVFLQEEDWRAAVEGREQPYPALYLRVSTGKNLSIMWKRDSSSYIEMTRKEE